ncbi:hypothetical protein SAMN04487833_1244 [Sarcina sp. DSM 11001]|nr:hypothetical protein SAMN04487833_1244 [Sarcina sp. DSM 11001]
MREFLIPIHIREEEELYSAFDPSGLTLSSSLTDVSVNPMTDCSGNCRTGTNGIC